MRRYPAASISLLCAAFAVVLTFAPGTMAQEASPGPDDLPMAAAPFGLATIVLPSGNAEIEALFESLPAAIGDEKRGPLERGIDRIQAPYGPVDPSFGPPMMLSALSFPDGDFFPTDFTAGAFVAIARLTEDYVATSFGRDGDLAWIRAESTVSVAGNTRGAPTVSRPMFTLAWGDIDSPWLFTAAATSPEGLDALVDAFVIAASGQVATPVAEIGSPWTIGIFGSAGRGHIGHIMVGIEPIHIVCFNAEVQSR